MALTAEDIDYIRSHLPEWLSEYHGTAAVNDPVLIERMVRVEEALRYQRDLITEILRQMDQRFTQMERRFEQVDRLFGALTQRMDRFMVWSFTTTMGAVALLFAALQLWPPG